LRDHALATASPDARRSLSGADNNLIKAAASSRSSPLLNVRPVMRSFATPGGANTASDPAARSDVTPAAPRPIARRPPLFHRVQLEGLERSMLEAMAMARPVITSDLAAGSDAVLAPPGVAKDRMTGPDVQERRRPELAAALIRLLSAPESDRLAVGRRGRERVVAQFATDEGATPNACPVRGTCTSSGLT